jgi:Ca-activated chloride channel homolog
MRFWFFSFFLFAGLLPAQELHENLSVDLVNVYLSATDSKGRFITDLNPTDLVLKENGSTQQISHFSNFTKQESDKLGEKDVPLTLSLVLDKSESMSAQIQGTNKMDIVKNAAFRLLDELRGNDRMALISFNDFASEETPFTSNKKVIGKDILFQDVEGGETALLDSIYFALEKLNGQQGRKIIVVFSDGEDTASNLKLDEVLSNLIASDVTVLAFGTMALGSNSMRGRFILERLAEASGGYAFFPRSLNGLNEIMEKLREGMRSQYSLGYKPLNGKKDGKWRAIEITCKRPGVKLRYRKGYNAS